MGDSTRFAVITLGKGLTEANVTNEERRVNYVAYVLCNVSEYPFDNPLLNFFFVSPITFFYFHLSLDHFDLVALPASNDGPCLRTNPFLSFIPTQTRSG